MNTTQTNEPTKFISSTTSKNWHIGVRKELRGERTGKVFSVYYVTKCSGAQLGGAWGQTEKNELPKGAVLCPRCSK